jgi:hypothetical protein
MPVQILDEFVRGALDPVLGDKIFSGRGWFPVRVSIHFNLFKCIDTEKGGSSGKF